MNIKKLNRIAKEIKANKDNPTIVEVRGWKYNRMIQGAKIYGWVTERESVSLLKRVKK
tara:strand:- start:836 stop:1009 length:174 start_codon:yes stop_codon:yes gene_type:complete